MVCAQSVWRPTVHRKFLFDCTSSQLEKQRSQASTDLACCSCNLLVTRKILPDSFWFWQTTQKLSAVSAQWCAVDKTVLTNPECCHSRNCLSSKTLPRERIPVTQSGHVNGSALADSLLVICFSLMWYTVVWQLHEHKPVYGNERNSCCCQKMHTWSTVFISLPVLVHLFHARKKAPFPVAVRDFSLQFFPPPKLEG